MLFSRLDFLPLRESLNRLHGEKLMRQSKSATPMMYRHFQRLAGELPPLQGIDRRSFQPRDGSGAHHGSANLEPAILNLPNEPSVPYVHGAQPGVTWSPILDLDEWKGDLVIDVPPSALTPEGHFLSVEVVINSFEIWPLISKAITFDTIAWGARAVVKRNDLIPLIGKGTNSLLVRVFVHTTDRPPTDADTSTSGLFCRLYNPEGLSWSAPVITRGLNAKGEFDIGELIWDTEATLWPLSFAYDGGWVNHPDIDQDPDTLVSIHGAYSGTRNSTSGSGYDFVQCWNVASDGAELTFYNVLDHLGETVSMQAEFTRNGRRYHTAWGEPFRLTYSGPGKALPRHHR